MNNDFKYFVEFVGFVFGRVGAEEGLNKGTAKGQLSSLLFSSNPGIYIYIYIYIYIL